VLPFSGVSGFVFHCIGLEYPLSSVRESLQLLGQQVWTIRLSTRSDDLNLLTARTPTLGQFIKQWNIVFLYQLA